MAVANNHKLALLTMMRELLLRKGLIEKLMQLTSEGQARMLNREVYILNRSKSENEKVYINVDMIHEAMGRVRRRDHRPLR